MSEYGDQLSCESPARRHLLKQAGAAGLLILAGGDGLARIVDAVGYRNGKLPAGCRDPLAGHIDGLL